MRKSIGFKLWTGMMVLVIIVLILLWLFQIVFLENFYTDMRVKNIKTEVTSIAKLFVNNNKEFENKLDEFVFNNNLSVEIIDSDGNILYQTGPNGQMPMMRHKERIEAFREVLTGREVTIPFSHPRFGNKFILIGIPIKNSGKVTGVLLLNMPLVPVEKTVSILKQQLVLITIILFIIAMLISYIISRTFTKPILEIKKVAEKMSSGDFSVRIKSTTNDEIGKLAETINNMGQQLSKIEKLRKEFIANISHELRTPLSLIRGYAETIKDVTGNNPEKRRKQLDIIIEESERLSKIVDDILSLSQIEAGYLNLKQEPFRINNTIEKVAKRYDILSEKTGIKILFENIKDIPVKADELRIEQVLHNLINNAFNHTPKGGSIKIKVIEEQDFVKVEISDTGTGISDEDLKFVWDRYYKADKTSKGKRVGTGLGLAIVKSILEAHQAFYGVESKQGIGTTFWFELPK